MSTTKIEFKEPTKAEYFKMAAAIAGLQMDEKTATLLCRLFESVSKKKGKFSIKDAAKIIVEVTDQFPKIEVKAVPNETKQEPLNDTTHAHQ